MPLHKGHEFLIETAAKQVEELTVMVCSIKSEPILGALRYQWVKETFPDIRVIHVTDENPQTPADHPFFWEIWKNTIERNCPRGIDTVFSSEEYGEKLAAQLNAKHVLVDLNRKTVPISATAIRQKPLDHWKFIPEAVRPHFIKKVVLAGPESVGKSVLSKKLAQHYQTNFVAEYGRDYCEKVGMDLNAIDFAHIAGGQLLLEDEAAKDSNKILFCDTDLIATQIWAEIFLKHCPKWILEINHARKYDLFLLLKPDIPWIDDGTRAYEHVRATQFERIREELEGRNLSYVIISGTYEERFKQAVAAIDEKIGKLQVEEGTIF